jgi:Cu/Ag efflux pump CusA
MRPLMNIKHREDHYFHPHPMQAMFALVASVTLAGLIVVALLLAFAR